MKFYYVLDFCHVIYFLALLSSRGAITTKIPTRHESSNLCHICILYIIYLIDRRSIDRSTIEDRLTIDNQRSTTDARRSTIHRPTNALLIFQALRSPPVLVGFCLGSGLRLRPMGYGNDDKLSDTIR